MSVMRVGDLNLSDSARARLTEADLDGEAFFDKTHGYVYEPRRPDPIPYHPDDVAHGMYRMGGGAPRAPRVDLDNPEYNADGTLRYSMMNGVPVMEAPAGEQRNPSPEPRISAERLRDQMHSAERSRWTTRLAGTGYGGPLPLTEVREAGGFAHATGNEGLLPYGTAPGAAAEMARRTYQAEYVLPQMQTRAGYDRELDVRHAQDTITALPRASAAQPIAPFERDARTRMDAAPTTSMTASLAASGVTLDAPQPTMELPYSADALGPMGGRAAAAARYTNTPWVGAPALDTRPRNREAPPLPQGEGYGAKGTEVVRLGQFTTEFAGYADTVLPVTENTRRQAVPIELRSDRALSLDERMRAYTESREDTAHAIALARASTAAAGVVSRPDMITRLPAGGLPTTNGSPVNVAAELRVGATALHAALADDGNPYVATLPAYVGDVLVERLPRALAPPLQASQALDLRPRYQSTEGTLQPAPRDNRPAVQHVPEPSRIELQGNPMRNMSTQEMDRRGVRMSARDLASQPTVERRATDAYFNLPDLQHGGTVQSRNTLVYGSDDPTPITTELLARNTDPTPTLPSHMLGLAIAPSPFREPWK